MNLINASICIIIFQYSIDLYVQILFIRIDIKCFPIIIYHTFNKMYNGVDGGTFKYLIQRMFLSS